TCWRFWISRAQGAESRTAAVLPSLEALSTTTASHGTDGGWCARECRQSTRASRAFQLTMTTETAGAPWPASPVRSIVHFSVSLDGLVGQGQELGSEALEAELLCPGRPPLGTGAPQRRVAVKALDGRRQ